jgi:hypothetical protein
MLTAIKSKLTRKPDPNPPSSPSTGGGSAASSSTATAISGTATNASAKNRPKPAPYKQCKDPIALPQDFDILLGRGKVAFNHHGNRRFRVFIGMHLRRYMEATNRMEKTLVVNSVSEAIHEAGGRFLKAKDSTETIWFQVNQKLAREKVGHALRDAVAMRLKMSNTSEPPVAIRRRASDIVMVTPRRTSTTEIQQTLSLLPRSDMERCSKSCSDLEEGLVGPSNSNMLPPAARPPVGDDAIDYNRGPSGINNVWRGIDQSSNSDEHTAGTESTTDTKKRGNVGGGLAKLVASMLQKVPTSSKSRPEESGEFSVASDVSKKWGGNNMESGDFTVASEIFEESEEQDQRMPELVAKVIHSMNDLETAAAATAAHGDSDKFGVNKLTSKRKVALAERQSPPSSLEFRNSPGTAARKGNPKSCDEISEEFSVMSIDTRLSRMAPPAADLMSGEFSIASEWGDTVSEEFGAAASRRRDTDKIHDDDHDVAFNPFMGHDSKKSFNSSDVSSRDLDVSASDLGIDLKQESMIRPESTTVSNIDTVDMSLEFSVTSKESGASVISTEC